MGDKLAEVMAKLNKLEKNVVEEKPIEKPKENETEDEEEEDDAEEEGEEEKAVEKEVEKKVDPKPIDAPKEDVVAGEVAILQNDGVFRREIMMVLHSIAGSLDKLASIVPKD